MFHFSDALYIVQYECTCIVFPLFCSHVIPVVLPDFHMKILNTTEHFMQEFTISRIFAWILRVSRANPARLA